MDPRPLNHILTEKCTENGKLVNQTPINPRNRRPIGGWIPSNIKTYIDNLIYRSNNDGFVASGDNYEPVLDAFSHWTYNESRGQMMVVDLQGVKQPNGDFMLTDPAIHSPTGDFGQDNKRAFGIASYFKTHVCNSLCDLLKLVKQDWLVLQYMWKRNA